MKNNSFSKTLGVYLLFSLSLVPLASLANLIGEVRADQSSVPISNVLSDKAQQVVERHREALLKVPGIQVVFPLDGKIYVHAVVYADSQGRRPQNLPSALAALPSTIEGIPLTLDVSYVLPPPPGVVILRPGGKREMAESCPSGYRETTDRGWRFCLDHARPEPIPGPMMALPIAGIPYEKVDEIMRRHESELLTRPGVHSVELGKNGIVVKGENPSVVLPKVIEGVPIEFQLEEKPGPIQRLSHTTTSTSTPVRPIGGGAGIGLISNNTVFGATLMPLGVSACGLWLVLPAHGIIPEACNPSPCTDVLDNCLNRYSEFNTKKVTQPPGSTSTIGQVIKWHRLVGGGDILDVAAAYLDSDFNQGNSSLCAQRSILQSTQSPFTGDERVPSVDDTVFVISALDPHVISAKVQRVDYNEDGDAQPCSAGLGTFPHNVRIRSQGRAWAFGDSGSPIITGDGRLVAILTWSRRDPEDNLLRRGGGLMASHIRSFFGLLRWYGHNTYPNHPQICQ